MFPANQRCECRVRHKKNTEEAQYLWWIILKNISREKTRIAKE